MAETLADIRKQTQQLESELATAVATLSRQIAPPFTPKLRERLLQHLAATQLPYARLNALWYRHLHLPETRHLPHFSADMAYFGSLRRRLNMLNELQTLLRNVVRAKQLPLMPEIPAVGTAPGQVMRAFEDVLYRIHDHISPPRPDPENYVGRHNDIPLPFGHFARLMQLARRTALALGRPTPLSFIDVGCGVGLKVLQATQVFEIAQGLEYDHTRVPVADGMIRHMRRTQDMVFQADALDFDGYGNYDVIYAYKPLSLLDLIIQMEERIVTQSRPGTVLVMPYGEFEGRCENYDVGRVAPLIYVTGYRDRDMKPLLRKIGQIGFMVPQDPSLRSFDEGFAAPLADALRHWGHLS